MAGSGRGCTALSLQESAATHPQAQSPCALPCLLPYRALPKDSPPGRQACLGTQASRDFVLLLGKQEAQSR